MASEHLTKDFFGDGYTIHHADGSKSSVSKNLLGDGYTIHHADGSKSSVSKNLLGDGYTIHGPREQSAGSSGLHPSGLLGGVIRRTVLLFIVVLLVAVIGEWLGEKWGGEWLGGVAIGYGAIAAIAWWTRERAAIRFETLCVAFLWLSGLAAGGLGAAVTYSFSGVAGFAAGGLLAAVSIIALAGSR
jgi:hypothetical protein